MNLSDLVMQFDLSDHAKKLTEQFGQGQAIDPGHFVGNFNRPPPPIQRPIARAPSQQFGVPRAPMMRTARDKARRMR